MTCLSWPFSLPPPRYRNCSRKPRASSCSIRLLEPWLPDRNLALSSCWKVRRREDRERSTWKYPNLMHQPRGRDGPGGCDIPHLGHPFEWVAAESRQSALHPQQSWQPLRLNPYVLLPMQSSLDWRPGFWVAVFTLASAKAARWDTERAPLQDSREGTSPIDACQRVELAD